MKLSIALSSYALLSPTAQQLRKNKAALLLALGRIQEWYAHPYLTRVAEVERHIKVIVQLFGYIPYDKPIYRVVGVSKAAFGAAKLKSVMTLAPPKRPVQSWTTNIGSAEIYFDEFIAGGSTDTYGLVFKLLSPGVELWHRAYMEQIFEKLSSYASEKWLLDSDEFDSFSYIVDSSQTMNEDEVLMRVDKAYTASVVGKLRYKR